MNKDRQAKDTAKRLNFLCLSDSFNYRHTAKFRVGQRNYSVELKKSALEPTGAYSVLITSNGKPCAVDAHNCCTISDAKLAVKKFYYHRIMSCD